MKKFQRIAAFLTALTCFQIFTACIKKGAGSENSESKKKTQTIIGVKEDSETEEAEKSKIASIPEKYKLDAKTAELLENTSDKEIEVYFTAELSDLEEIPELLPLYYTLIQLEEFDNVELICFDPNEDTDIASLIDPTNLLAAEVGDVFVKSGDITRKVSRNLIFGNEMTEYAGEDLIGGAIKICTSGSLPTVYFLTGHGEKSIDDSYKIYADQLRSYNYDVQELNLDEESVVPENAEIIYSAGPQSDITAHEAELLGGFLESGGAASFLISPCETEGRFLNIEAILEEFGILVDYNFVTEKNSGHMLRNRENEVSESFMQVQYVPRADGCSEDLTSDIINLIEYGGYTAGISNTRSFAEIPDEAFANAGNVEVSPIIRNIPFSEDGSYSTVSRSMGGDDTTSSEANALSGVELAFGYYSYNKLTGGKVIVIGSTDMIDADKVSPAVNGTGILALSTNTWLYENDGRLGIENK